MIFDLFAADFERLLSKNYCAKTASREHVSSQQ